jgi:hypothetical protein
MNTFVLVPVVAFAAVVIWLTVRVANRRKGWAKWTLALAVGLPMLYVASFGPACWLSAVPRLSLVEKGDQRPPALLANYAPLARVIAGDVPAASKALKWWACAGMRRDYITWIPVSGGLLALWNR